jgi:hypothetical protein
LVSLPDHPHCVTFCISGDCIEFDNISFDLHHIDVPAPLPVVVAAGFGEPLKNPWQWRERFQDGS